MAHLLLGKTNVNKTQKIHINKKETHKYKINEPPAAGACPPKDQPQLVKGPSEGHAAPHGQDPPHPEQASPQG